MSDFSHVPSIMISVRDEEFKDTFQKDRLLVADWIGSIFNQNSFMDKASLSHSQLTNWVGGYSMNLMSTTSYRAWTFDDIKNKVLWERIMWRIIHVYPLGFLITRNKYFTSPDKGSWNPAFESLTSYSKNARVSIDISNRSIGGAPIGLAIYLKIFGDDFGFDDNASIMQALCDVFSSTPNIDNPFFVCIRRALKRSILLNPYPMPYFWEDFLTYLYSSIPTEFAQLGKAALTQNQVKDFDLSELINSKQEAEKPHLSVVETTPKTEEMQPPETKELIADEPKSDVAEQTVQFEALFSKICTGLEDGSFVANQKGAVLHKISDYYFLVHPLWIDKATEVLGPFVSNINNEDMANHCISNSHIKVYSGKIIIKKSKLSTILALLNPTLTERLPANIKALENNTDIVIEKEL